MLNGSTSEQNRKDWTIKISYNPPGDGLCFYSAAGFQLGLSSRSRTVQNIVFEYLESNRYDVSIAIFFDPKI